MLTIFYDPINGTAIPDGLAESKAREIWNDWNNQTVICDTNPPIGSTFCTSSEILLDAFRTLVAEDVIPETEIKFSFEGQIIYLNKYGNLNMSIRGFYDIKENFLWRILDLDGEFKKLKK